MGLGNKSLLRKADYVMETMHIFVNFIVNVGWSADRLISKILFAG